MDSMETVKILKALADANRLHILELLGSGEQCACVLLGNLPLSQPTLSHHMRIGACLQALGHTTPTDDLATDCHCRE